MVVGGGVEVGEWRGAEATLFCVSVWLGLSKHRGKELDERGGIQIINNFPTSEESADPRCGVISVGEDQEYDWSWLLLCLRCCHERL